MGSKTLTTGIAISLAIHAAILLFPRMSGDNNRAETGYIEVGVAYQTAPPSPSATSTHEQRQQSVPMALTKKTDKSPLPSDKNIPLARSKSTPAKPVKQLTGIKNEAPKTLPVHTDAPVIKADNRLHRTVERKVLAQSDMAGADKTDNETRSGWSTMKTSTAPLTETSLRSGRTYEHNRSIPLQKKITRSPRYHFNPPPNYPTLALKRRWQGEVVLHVDVDEQGAVIDAKIKNSSGHSLLDDTALETVRNWKFHPARSGNKNVSEQVLLPIRFELPKS